MNFVVNPVAPAELPALLELIRLQAILIRQDKTFGDIVVKKHVKFDEVLNGPDAGVRDDWR